ncbi:MAG TPA: CYCXC family (seleno)protein [Candidatus Acidoferrales bacterium]|nr:CYCXC family (seleno)protein [Candidatus Acidoferrales bacterium]
MNGRVKAVTIAFCISLAGATLTQLYPAFGADTYSQDQMNMSGPTDLGIPSYHAYALKAPFPVTLDPKQFPDALNRNVYALAAKIRPVLYQQPCYCYCDRHAGHKSLLDCFVSTHGAECDICQKEAVLAYQLTQKGKTPAQIRAAIIRGDWRALNLNPYMAAVSSH